MLSSFARRIKLFIDRNLLLKPGGFYLVALSGGCDSVALLRVMIELGYHIAVIHCNFQLRGEESERDERFIEFILIQESMQNFIISVLKWLHVNCVINILNS